MGLINHPFGLAPADIEQRNHSAHIFLKDAECRAEFDEVRRRIEAQRLVCRREMSVGEKFQTRRRRLVWEMHSRVQEIVCRREDVVALFASIEREVFEVSVAVCKDVVEKNEEEHLGVLHGGRRTEPPHKIGQFFIARVILVVFAMRLRRMPRELAEVLLLHTLAIAPIKAPREIGVFAVLHLHEFMFRRLDAEHLLRNVHRKRLVRRDVGCKFRVRVAGNGLQDIVATRLHDGKSAADALQLYLVLHARYGRAARLLPVNGEVQV